jgi:stringent starvation protein B
MSEPTSTKPYMIRAIYEWCVDNGFTPHVLVAVDAATRVPHGFVKNGEIVLNINYSATKDLLIGNDAITFSARFNGVSSDLYIPMDAVRAVFARENGQGVFFDAETAQRDQPSHVQSAENSVNASEPAPATGKKPSLRLVK